MKQTKTKFGYSVRTGGLKNTGFKQTAGKVNYLTPKQWDKLSQEQKTNKFNKSYDDYLRLKRNLK